MSKLPFTVRPLSDVLSAAALSGDGSLVDQIYAVLRKRIVDLSLPPDVALVEQEVARVLGVSKTPVREAIIRLSREGLVQVVPKSGSYVSAISLERYLESYFVRTQLEVGCVKRLALRGISLADQVALNAILSEQDAAMQAGDGRLFSELDQAFHKRMFEIAGLTSAWQILLLSIAELDRVRQLKRLFGQRQQQAILDEHAAIVQAIVDRDPIQAEVSLLENIGAVDDEMLALSKMPDLLRSIDDLNKLVSLDRRSRGPSKQAAA